MMQSLWSANDHNHASATLLDALSIQHGPAGIQKVVHIRPYVRKDRRAIRTLCCETGFLGRPVDSLFHDRELFADLFTNAYLDYQPEWALVAEADARVVGYLLGAVSRHFDLLLMRSGLITTLKMVWRVASGRYSQYPRSRRFVRWLLTSGYGEQPKHPPGAAHLHCDLERGFRGRGIGRRLWETYDGRLEQAGVTHCYGSFFSYSKRRPETAYRRYGFSVFGRRRTTLFEPDISDPVEVVCVQKRLGPVL